MKLISKKYIGERNVFDLTVENNHCYFAGNTLVHNCSQSGLQRLVMQFKPTTFYDIAVLVSVYRPGPLGSGMDKLLLRGNENPELIVYEHPILEEILKPSKGCIVFQEQVMAIGNKLGKFTLAETEIFRKLISKKQKGDGLKAMEEYKERFIKGCLENNFPENKAINLWDSLSFFSGYGFCKAHAASYAVNTFQTAWLATYHPLEFYASVLTKANAGEKQEYVDEIVRLGYKVLPVDVNKSKNDTILESGGIRLAFTLVNGVGETAIPKIIAGQPYTDLPDFIQRSGATKTAIMPLAKVGALDCLDNNLGRLLAHLELFYSHPTKYKSKKGFEEFLIQCQNPEFEKIKDLQVHERMVLERELLGFSLAGSPFSVLGRDKKLKDLISVYEMDYEQFIESEESDAMFPVVVKDYREKAQKKTGKMMAFIKLGTQSGKDFEVPCFAGLWQHIAKLIQIGNVYLAGFTRDFEKNPLGLQLGTTGRWWYSQRQAQDIFIDIDKF